MKMPDKEEELEVVHRPRNELEGRILEGVLRGEDIPCYLRSRQIPWMDDIMEMIEGYWGELLVPHHAVPRAKEAIRSYLEGEEEQ